MELVAAAVADLIVALREAAAVDHRKIVQAEARAEAAEKQLPDLKAAQLERDKMRGDLELAVRERDEYAAKIAEWEKFEEAAKSPRRTHIEDEVGIYSAQTADGETVLEVCFPDDQGKTRWRRLSPDDDIDVARALREELAGQPYEPDPENPDPDPDGDGAGESKGARRPRGRRGRRGRTVGDQQAEPVAAGEEA